MVAKAAGGLVLAPAERRCLEAVCEALLPVLDPGGGDDPRLFALSAAQLGVADAIEEALAALDESQQLQFRLLLRVLEWSLAVRLLTGKARGFSRLPQADRHRVRLALPTHR